MLRILVTGATGQVGMYLAELHQLVAAEWIFAKRSDCDLSNHAQLLECLDQVQPDLIINTAAYTAVDQAESEEDLAFAINTHAVFHMAHWCLQHQSRIIHFSSDYVYHNTLRRPLIETDPTDPKGIYARSKLGGDIALQTILPHGHIILRTSWVYAHQGKNFVRTMLRLQEGGKALRIIDDQVGCPTYAWNLAQVVCEISNKWQKLNWDPTKAGIYHYCNAGTTTWYGFAKKIFALKNIEVDITPITTTEYPTPAQRPEYSVLDCTKIMQTWNIHIPAWEDALKNCLLKISQ